MASASHEENGGDAVTIRAPPPTHPLLTGRMFRTLLLKEPEPTIPAFATPNRLSDA
jgi:hypothetical protein